MVDVFREFVAHCGADFIGSLAEQIISSSETADVWYRFNVPYENVRHVSKYYSGRL
jgi:hypothetical protein